jgi:hypothetical protein
MGEQEQKKITPEYIEALLKNKKKANFFLHTGIRLTGFVREHGVDGVIIGESPDGRDPGTLILFSALGSIVESRKTDR